MRGELKYFMPASGAPCVTITGRIKLVSLFVDNLVIGT
jgi:hypothetical protein